MTAIIPTGSLPTGIGSVLPPLPQGLQALVVSSTEIQLIWTLDPDASGFNVYVDNVFYVNTTLNTISVTGLSPSTSYAFRLNTTGDEVGLESAIGLVVVASTLSNTLSLGSNDVICVDNASIFYWQASNAYALNDVVNANNDSDLFAYECTTAGTSGATQPTWPSAAGGTVVDGTAIWTARNPYTWIYALRTINKAINHYRSVASEKRDIWMEVSHNEIYSADYSVQGDTKSIDTIPAVYLVDKALDLYTPNTSLTPNISTSAAFRQVAILAHIFFFGLRIESQENFVTGSDVISFEDCTIAYSYGGNTNSFQVSNSHLVALNTSFDANNTSNNDMLFFDSTNASIEFIGCTFELNTVSTGFMQKVNVLGNQWVTYDSCDFNTFNNPLMLDSSDISLGSNSFADDGRIDLDYYNCDLPVAYSLWDGTWVANRNVSIALTNCNAVNSKTWINDYRDISGTYTFSDTVYAQLGYQETENSQNLSILMTTTARLQPPFGVVSPRIGGYFPSPGSYTLKIKLLENFTVPLTKNLIWVELYYFEGVTDLVRTLDKSSREYAQPAFTTLAASTDVWVGTPGGFTAREITIPIVTGRAGQFYGLVRLLAQEAGKQVYIDTEFELL